jgi:hypothetical protein
VGFSEGSLVEAATFCSLSTVQDSLRTCTGPVRNSGEFKPFEFLTARLQLDGPGFDQKQAVTICGKVQATARITASRRREGEHGLE